MIWVPIGALAPKDEPEGELHTKGRTDTDDGDWYSAQKHAWAASAEEHATYARRPAMRGMRQAPRTLLGGPAVAASTQSDQRRSAAYHSHCSAVAAAWRAARDDVFVQAFTLMLGAHGAARALLLGTGDRTVVYATCNADAYCCACFFASWGE